MRDSSSLTRAALQAAWSKNAFETRVLDVGRLASFTDMFVILSGRSDRHVLAIADAVETDLKKQGLLPMGVEGRQGGTWVLLDYGSVVIHVFEKGTRAFYDLERLWSDAEVVPVEEPSWVTEFARMESSEA
jgi:ribosome-associated protein